MFRNVASQKIALFAFITATGAAKTGDAANLTAYVSKDFGAVTVLGDTSGTEMDATNAPGWYLFDLTQGETNADALLFTAKSSTSGVSVVGRPVDTTPNRFSSMVIDAAGLVDANTVKVGPTGSGTAQTAGDIIGDTNDIQTRLPAALVSGRMDSSVGAVVNGVIVAASFAANALDAVWSTAARLLTAGTNIVLAKGTGVTGFNDLSAAQVNAEADTAISDAALATAANLAVVAGYIDTEIGTLQTSVNDLPTNSEMATALGTADDAVLAAIGALSIPTAAAISDAVWDETLSGHAGVGSTGAALAAAGGSGDPWATALPGAYGAGTAGQIVGDFLDAAVSDLPTAIENADALLNRDMSAVSDTNARSPLNALRFLRNKWSIAATTLTVTKENDSTAAWTATVATTPGADPITGNDPA